MTEHYQIYKHNKQDINEIFITAVPQVEIAESQAREIYTRIAKDLNEHKSNIFQERVFATKDAMNIIKEVRADILGPLADNVPPSYLVCEYGQTGPVAGVQVHAVNNNEPMEIIKTPDNTPCGRLLTTPNHRYLGISALSAINAGSAPDQAYSMFNQVNNILKSFDSSFLSVPRTWLWLKNILDWYDEFNQSRNRFFTENQILGPKQGQPMPASTGIGLSPANGAACAIDLTAVLKPQGQIKYLQAGGKQQSAFDYGSAFSRASSAPTPSGTGVFISGTASIDKNGNTTNLNNAQAQITDTITNVKAVLKDMSCSQEDIVHVMVYSKTPEIEKIFHSLNNKPKWPWIPMICDVCRDDLLFEIEVFANKSYTRHL